MSPWQYARRALVLGMLVLATGCSIYSAPGSQPAPVERRPEPPVTSAPIPPAQPRPTPPPPEPNASSAYGPLLAKAEQASATGDYEQALALLERAQRIDPDSGDVYLALAQTYAAKGDSSLARATAERGLLYCGDQAQCNALRELTR